jgi:hypothetical protein
MLNSAHASIRYCSYRSIGKQKEGGHRCSARRMDEVKNDDAELRAAVEDVMKRVK